MTDRELLELAANAANIRHITYPKTYDGWAGLMLCDENGKQTEVWNPLKDHTQAWALCVDIGGEFWYTDTTAKASKLYDNSLITQYFAEEPIKSDKTLAANRAIVRVAAMIGRGLCVNQ